MTTTCNLSSHTSSIKSYHYFLPQHTTSFLSLGFPFPIHLTLNKSNIICNAQEHVKNQCTVVWQQHLVQSNKMLKNAKRDFCTWTVLKRESATTISWGSTVFTCLVTMRGFDEGSRFCYISISFALFQLAFAATIYATQVAFWNLWFSSFLVLAACANIMVFRSGCFRSKLYGNALSMLCPMMTVIIN